MELNIFRSSFNAIVSVPCESLPQQRLEQECKRILQSGEKVEISQLSQHFANFPYMVRLILSLYYTLSHKLHYNDPHCDPAALGHFLSTPLKTSLLKLLATIIEKRLFESKDQQIDEEVSYSLIFKSSLFPFVLSILSQNTNYVGLQKLIAFYSNLCSDQHSLVLPICVYHLYGGGPFTIEAKIFKEKLTQMVENIGKVLSTSETIINRNIEQFKSNKERAVFLEESVKTVMISKNKEALAEFVTFITTPIFLNREYLQRDEFLFQLQARPVEPTLSIFLLLARSEILLFEEKTFRASLLLRSEISKSNFYTTQMTKLFNKCPFNGDERCSCKKCQCVRRNRESAKLSQQKKRNAVEQLQNFKKRITELEERDKLQEKRINDLEAKQKVQKKRNIQLEEENMMLKSLLKEMKANPNIKLLMMQTIEPLSKVLNNDM